MAPSSCRSRWHQRGDPPRAIASSRRPGHVLVAATWSAHARRGDVAPERGLVPPRGGQPLPPSGAGTEEGDVFESAGMSVTILEVEHGGRASPASSSTRDFRRPGSCGSTSRDRVLRRDAGSEGALPLHPTGSAPRPVRWVAPRGYSNSAKAASLTPSVRGRRLLSFALPKATQWKGQAALPLVG